MCNKHSFIVTRAGKVHDGCGLTDSHTTICAIAGLGENDSTTWTMEWQPPKGWPDGDWHAGLIRDNGPFPFWALKKKHLDAMERHVRSLFPDMAAWNTPRTAYIPKGLTVWPGDLTVEGGTLDAPALKKIGGDVIIREGATFNAPSVARVGGDAVIRAGATFTAPTLTEIGGYVIVGEGATFNAPTLTEVGGYVFVSEGATFNALNLTR